MDKKFEEWVDEFARDWKESKSYDSMVSKGWSENAHKLLGWYLQFKQAQAHEKILWWTRSLAIATWVLALATILLIKFH
jgi:hypothetical protein